MLFHAWNYVYQLCGENAFYLEVFGSVFVSGGLFWILCGLLLVVDSTGKPQWMLKYKTQPGTNQPADRKKLRKAINVAVFNQTVISLPASFIVYWLRVQLGAPYKPEDLPSALVVLRDLALCAVAEEIGFYYTHRLVHWGPLYKSIHKMHHEWTAPMGVVAVYAHPIEYVVSNIIPFVLGPLLLKSHLMTSWLWFSIAITWTVCHHSGYHLPLLPSPEFHDYHHLKFTGNYGVLGWLDYIHGTDEQFRHSVQFSRHRINMRLTPVNELHPESTDK